MFSQPEPIWTWGIFAAVWAAGILREVYLWRRRREHEHRARALATRRAASIESDATNPSTPAAAAALLRPWIAAWLLVVGAVVVVSAALSRG
jgi:hypothetical protein